MATDSPHRIEAATSILVFGSGALGVRKCKYTTRHACLPDCPTKFTAEITDVYSTKKVTLVYPSVSRRDGRFEVDRFRPVN